MGSHRTCAFLLLGVLSALAGTANAAGLEVPLTVQESTGVARQSEPVTFGVPLPQGLITDVTRLRLYTQGAKPVPAAFSVVNRWHDDRSVQWVHADFLADAPAHGKTIYYLRLSDEPAARPTAPLRVDVQGDDVRIDTGVARFTVHRTGAFLDAPGLKGADLVLRSDERFYKASQWHDTQLIVEESNPLKVVLKRTGSHGWADGQDRALDYTLRIVTWAGQPSVQLIYTFVNRQGRAMSDFVRLDGLWLEAQLEPSSRATRVEQLAATPRRTGWFSAGRVGIGLRWWWQLYPKGFEVTADGRLRLAIFPETARPQNIYRGVAKTHEVTLALDGRSRAAQLEQPLFPVAPPRWYTRETRALGRLAESSPEAVQNEYRSLLVKYDEWLKKARDAVLAKRARGVVFRGQHLDEYGMLNFGDAIHKIEQDTREVDYGVHWETEYYDFPHTLFLHFFRTGDLTSLRTAIEAAAHHADVDITHRDVRTGYDGAPRTGPGLNHWVRYSNGLFVSGGWAFYKNEGIFDRWLLTGDLWSRDVARLSADYGVTADDLDLDNNTRSIGHGLFAMMKAYEVFGDKKYLDRLNWIIDTTHAWQDGDVMRLKRLNPRAVWQPRYKGGYSDQAWTYGITLEAMAQAHLLTKRKEMPGYMKRAADWLLANPQEWDPATRRFFYYPDLAVMMTPGFGYITETTGDRRYWEIAIEGFRRQTGQQDATDRMKLFAQYFRNSQRFLWYLSEEARASMADAASNR
jgi:beta-L-arabinofuranosidase (glycosyl hydrolase family 127)/exo-rhamnogalacturonan lyase-like protein